VPGTPETDTLRRALLELHRVLLDGQRIQAERFGGRMSGAEVLQAAADDLRFSWLTELSTLIAALDEALSDGDPAGVRAAVDRARALLDPPDGDSGFGRRYLQALQDQPDAVLAHRDVGRALAYLDRDA
jgi:hypothetical protein